MNEKYLPKRGDKFTAYVTRTKKIKDEDGKPCDIQTRNGPYWCCKRHTVNNGRFVVSIAAVDSAADYRKFLKSKENKDTTFTFSTSVYRFEQI
ncbi:MAG: hypothetical protein MUO31_06655 [Thermodesulfovibrionales bacterium]|nr:hypothetical protein [Thermodesulfovibrionales bacterium]